MPASRRKAKSAPRNVNDRGNVDSTISSPAPTATPDVIETRLRFARRSRLADSQAFSRVFKRSKRSRDSLFTVLYCSSDRPNSRLGLAIAKKHCKLATARNRIKRLVRESFRQNSRELEGFDIVVMNTRATHAADNQSLTRSLQRHWKRISGSRRNQRPD